MLMATDTVQTVSETDRLSSTKMSCPKLSSHTLERQEFGIWNEKSVPFAVQKRWNMLRQKMLATPVSFPAHIIRWLLPS